MKTVVFLLLYAGTGFAQSAPDVEALWQRASILCDMRNYQAALPLLREAGKLGHPRAQALLGAMYRDGVEVRQNAREAAHWFAAAASQGHRVAQFALAGMYEQGEGVPRDFKMAAGLYQKSARQGLAEAQVALGISYEFGHGIPRNRETATFWLDRAAAQGRADARWLSRWLKLPGTPAFQNQRELSTYISATVIAWYAGTLPARTARNLVEEVMNRRHCGDIARILENAGKSQEAALCRNGEYNGCQ